jgi:hypothetical protein
MRDSMRRRPLKRSKEIWRRAEKCFKVNFLHFPSKFKTSKISENKGKHAFRRGALWKTRQKIFIRAHESMGTVSRVFVFGFWKIL